MESIAKYRYVRSSAQKVRLIVGIIKGKKATNALELLNFINKKSAILVKNTLKSAIANATYNDGANINNLRIVKVFVDNGPSIKRMMIRAKGRSDRIVKRTSHLTIVVSDQ